MANGFRWDLKASDVAWHPDESEGFFELWDCYCVFNEGYKCFIEFFSSPWYPFIDYRAGEARNPANILGITSPDGITHTFRKSYPNSLFKASKETLDVTIGENRLLGKFGPDGKYEGLHVRISGDGLGADLTYRVKVGAWKMSERDDNLTYYNPATKKYFGWFVMGARSEVEGTLTINGKSVKVSGLGFNNYNRGNIILSDIQTRWFFSAIYASEYTVIYSDSTATKLHNYAHFTPFVLWKGNDVIMSTYNCVACGEKYVIDPTARGPYPVEETFRARDGDTEVTGHLLPGVVSENSRLEHIPGFPFTKENPCFHFWQFSDADLQIKRGGQLEKVKGQALREFVWMEEWFPYRK